MDISLSRVAELLQRSDSIVITAHVHSDGDSLGSSLALWQYLSSIGKDVQILIDEDIPRIYSFLPGIEAIYRPTSAMAADLLVVLDASNVDRISRVKDAVKAPVLNLDHHISNTRFADYLYLDTKSPATGQIVLELLKLLSAPITEEIAVCLYTAIATDCGFFRYANTTPAAMRYAAELMELGAKPYLISEAIETKPIESIRALAKVLDTLQLHCDGKVATITIEPSIAETIENSEGFVNYPRNIEGVEIAILFKYLDAETLRVSLRSQGADVSRIAVAFGGGGHIRAAGCTMTGNIHESKQKLIAKAGELLLELQNG